MNGEVSQSREDLSTVESELRVEKLSLERDKTMREISKLDIEQEKLSLEHTLLRRQLSLQGLMLEWLKAATVPAALVGVVVTFFIGSGQMRETQENRNAERFDKALTRLASDKINERLTGVSALRQFLFEPDETRKKATLYFLVNAIAIEDDRTVQGTILDILREQKASVPFARAARRDDRESSGETRNSRLTQAMLDEALRTALDRNRGLTKTVLDANEGRANGARGALLAKLKEILSKMKKRTVIAHAPLGWSV